MTVIEDIYRLTTQSDTSSLQAAQQVLGAQIGNLKARMAGMAASAAHTARELGRLRPTAAGAAMAFQNMARGAGVAMRGMGGLFNIAARGVGILGRIGGIALGAVGGIAALGIGAFNALGGMDALNNAMAGVTSGGGGVSGAADGAADSMEGMGKSAEKAGEDTATGASKAAAGIGKIGAAAQDTEEKIAGLTGAFGDVGAGFIQRQGRAAETVTKQGKEVAESMGSVDSALESTEAAIETAQDKIGSFGEETSRLGKAWENIKNIFLRAIGTAILPLINALATALEDPRFIKFVTLLAEDIAGAISVVVDWLINKAIPAVLNFLDEVNNAGGPVEWVKKKFNELKATVMRVIAIIIGYLLKAANAATNIFEGIGAVATALWTRIRTTFLQLVAILLAGLIRLRNFFQNILDAIGAYAAQKWREITAKAGEMFDNIRAKFAAFKSGLESAWNAMTTAITDLWQRITDKAGEMFDNIKAKFATFKSNLESAWNTMITALAALWQSVVDKATAMFTSIRSGFDTFKSALSTAWNTFTAALGTAWAAVTTKAGEMFTGIKAKFDAFKTTFESAWQDVSDFITGIWTTIKTAISDAFTAIGGFGGGLLEKLTAPFQGLFNFIGGPDGIMGKIKRAFADGINGVIGALNGLIRAYNIVATALGLPPLGELPPISLARGGIALQPLLAMIGDAPTPEVVAPLGDLLPMIARTVREALGTVGGAGALSTAGAGAISAGAFTDNSMTVEKIEVNVSALPGGDARQTGAQIAQGIKSEMTRMRQAGIRIPAGAL